MTLTLKVEDLMIEKLTALQGVLWEHENGM